MTAKLIKACPIASNGNELTFKLLDVDDEKTGNPASEIESAHKIYILKTWHSETMEATYTRKESVPMTSPTPTPPDRMTRTEVMDAFESLHAENAAIREELSFQREKVEQLAESLTSLFDGLTELIQRAPQPASASAPASAEFIADTITLDYIDGKANYKAKGGRFTKFGVRVWPEVLPLLGIDPETLKPGPNQITPTTVKIELTAEGQPRKVTGKV